MNLINDSWIPITTISSNEGKKYISTQEIACQSPPVFDIAAPRPDFQGALYQFLIGLLQTCFAPKDMDEWHALWLQPPTSVQLEKAFGPVARAFELLSTEGPAFMQDFDLAAGEDKPISNLLIDAPGDKTLSDNLDLFIKRNVVQHICSSCAATALYTLQTNAPSGGAGHRVGLRGGGPLTTLIKPSHANASLWQKLWINVLPQNTFNSGKDLDENVFPWLAPTHTSEKAGSEILCDQVNPLQAYWGMPRRIRLHPPESAGMCDICGLKSSELFNGYKTKNYGINYGDDWLHPLTPYSFDTNKKKPPLSVKGKRGKLTYQYWLGLSFHDSETGDESAKIVQHYHDHKALYLDDFSAPQLWCFGFDIDKAKACCWYENQLPLFSVDREAILGWLSDFLKAARETCTLLRRQVKEAWFSRPEDAKGDFSFIDKDFWQSTESNFYQILPEILATPAEQTFPSANCYRRWKQVLLNATNERFDHWTLTAAPEALKMQRIVAAKNKLMKFFHGNKAIKILNEHATSAEEAA